jgi:LptD protein
LKAKLLLIILLFFVNLQRFTAQTIPPERDTIPPLEKANLNAGDTVPIVLPPRDSTISISNNQNIKYSKDSLDAPITYDSQDSMILDIKNKKVHLYGKAVVTYTSLELTADYIIFDWGNNIVEAVGLPDSVGNISGNPVFKESDQTFNAKRIRYNFKTKKGLVYEATTQEKDVYVLGKVGKMHSKDESKGQTDDYIFSENAIFTTCDHPDPHFGIRSQKQKVIPNKVVVVGPSNLEVGGVPTPLWLPFAFFPLKKGERTGLIFPRDYEFSDAWGFGLRNVGWYFPINDYLDLTVSGDIYTRGSWGLKLNSKYRKNYKFSGSLTLGFSDRRSEERGVPISNKSYTLQWSHTQDPKAHPLNRFSGSVNIQSNNYQSLNLNDFNSKYQNTLTSNINYTRLFPDKPFRFTASMSHSQNTQTRKVDIKLPTADFQLTRIYPFKRKAGTGKDKWFEKISLQYTANAQNRISATDTTLFSQQTLDDMQFGIKHTANTNASFQVLKFFNITPAINYKEIWYFDHVQKELDPSLVVDTTWVVIDPDFPDSVKMELDTVSYGTVEDLKVRGFKPLRLFNTNISVSTQIFGTKRFSKGKIRGLRHVLKPIVSFGYTPDYTNPSLGYFDYVDTDTRPEFNNPERYDIFENGIYDRTPTGGKAMSLSYSLNNIFEAKVWSKRDSTEKNIKLFDNFRINGDYNFAADSFQLSRVRMNGTTRLFKGITTLTFSASFDPYAFDVEEGRRINKFYWDTDRKFLRFEAASLRFNTGLTINKIRDIVTGKDKNEKSEPASAKLGDEGILDMFAGFRISHQLAFTGMTQLNGRDTFFVSTNSITMSGSIKLTRKWSLRVGNISYDFKLNRLVYPDIGFYRDLHCWQMGMDWQPANGTYSFYLNVKPGSLDFIKVPYQRGNQDAFRGF